MADPSSLEPSLAESLGADAMGAGLFVLGLFALFAIAGITKARRETRKAARLARERGASITQLLRTVRMAESIADIGVWQYNPNSGEQQWSAGMRRLFGLEEKGPLGDGDAATALFANDIDLIGPVMKHSDTRTPFTLRYDLHADGRGARTIELQACNLVGKDGRIARVVAVVRDITEDAMLERASDGRQLIEGHEADEARALADTDPLTGLANRRLTMAALERRISEAREANDPLALIIFDIDDLKSFNAQLGRETGDRVLCQVAEIARREANGEGMIGRVGGEEFAWLMPSVTANIAHQRAQSLRTRIASESALDGACNVTVSLGIANLRETDSAPDLFARAESALYDAKNGGRNGLKLAE